MLHSEPTVAPELDLETVIKSVCGTNSPITISSDDGNAVKVIPVPKPVEFFKGRPVYRLEDAKYLYLDCPWLLE
ncbi:MAG TPA: hypothetical protein VKX17_07130 [Planctomycetota bacterium]|nr:hypothetical protein [Planctomycetota bacterium]